MNTFNLFIIQRIVTTIYTIELFLFNLRNYLYTNKQKAYINFAADTHW